MFRGPRRWQPVALLAVALALPARAAPPTTCGSELPYERALCAYQHRQFAEAQAGFSAIVEKNEPDSQTLRATYFLARIWMKVGRFDEAETLLIRIYGMSRAFFDEWNVDYLLGVCRKALGKG